ncbi:MAG TPA: glucose 1-dehydrogenase [Xanthobacteraceae bacterium]|nr:glucose 1-dehydrogenase [Xanthobacteraceae bacterium]
MLALSVIPGVDHSSRLEEAPEPPLSDGAVLVETIAIGICGTDREIIEGHYGAAPPGAKRLIIGHESLGRVVEAPDRGPIQKGDHVVGIVRRPDPVPCPACANGEWDMCRNNLYTERGIKQRDGYASQRFRIEPDFAIKIDPSLGFRGVLVEPTSVVAKAWEQVERIGNRSPSWHPRTALVTGAGSIGLLAALLGLQRGYAVHVFDQVETGAKPDLVRALGASYHHGSLRDLKPDLVLECTGATSVILEVVERVVPAGIVCLAGVSTGGREIEFDVGKYNRSMVLENTVVFGTVNANRRHYEAAALALARADSRWLERLISRRVPLERWPEALEHRADDIKVVLEFAA